MDGVTGESVSSPMVDWVPLPDVSKETLADMLAGVGGEQLRRGVQRLVSSLDDPNGVISAFSSFVE